LRGDESRRRSRRRGRRCWLGWRRCGWFYRRRCGRRGGDRLRFHRRGGWTRRCSRGNWRSGSRLLLVNQLQHVPRLGDVRQINFRFDFVSIAAGSSGAGRRGLCLSGSAEVGPHLLCFVLFHRTGMRFLLGDADCDQDIENRFAFNFQLPGQIVDSNLTHPPFPCPAPLLKSSSHPHGVRVAHRLATLVTSAANPVHSFGLAEVSSSPPSVCATSCSTEFGSVSSAAAATS